MEGEGAVPQVQKSRATSWILLLSRMQKLSILAFAASSDVRARVPGQSWPRLWPS
jgi:hypothetical protein